MEEKTIKLPGWAKTAIKVILIAWGAISFFILCGDVPEGSEMSEVRFFVSKALAFASLFGSIYVWHKAQEHKLI